MAEPPNRRKSAVRARPAEASTEASAPEPSLFADTASGMAPGMAPGTDTDENQAADAPPPHYLGHRERLRARFLEHGAASLQDHELLELVLFTAIPRRDVKPLAKDLLREFGNLWAVLTAAPDRLRRVFRFSDATIAAITIIGAAALRMTRSQMLNRPVLSSWQTLLDYCQGAMATEAVEQFRLLFLDRKNVLIAEEIHQRGTIDHTPAYPREVVRRALELNAAALVLVHNHPSGDPTPSRDDISMTREIRNAAATMGITIHDHLIIARGGVASFKALGLL